MLNSFPKTVKKLNNRYIRIAVLMLVDALIVTLSLLLAFWLRFDFVDGYRQYTAYAHRFTMLPWLIAIRWICGWFGNTYRWSFSHASLSEGVNICLAVLAGSIIFAVLGQFTEIFSVHPPRSIYFMEAALSLAGMCFVRFFPKYAYLLYNTYYAEKGENVVTKRIIIFGAGGNAELLARELTRADGHGYELIGFVDDNPSKWGSRIHGCKVLGAIGELPALIDKYQVQEILVAIPNFSGEPLRQLVEICGPKNVKFKIVPPYPLVIASGNVLRLIEDIKPESLLERQVVKFDQEKVNRLLGEKTVLVTGAAGSIGSELCRQTASQGIRKLILFDLNENDLYFLRAELAESYPKLDLALRIGSVRDRACLDRLMLEQKPDIVFHAAAHKHVPLMEDSPCEAVKNNILGTHETAASAMANSVESFILVSTDKAVASANMMGASKSLAELVVREINKKGTMRCSTVRFGNVLGSSGSLLQIIRRQIAKGGPVTVTHKDMFRYFMTIPEAVALILMAAALDEGDTYILDMGKSVSVDKLVRQVVMLSGLTPDRDIEIRYTSPRPGEKFFEELHTGDEKLAPSSFPRIKVVSGRNDDLRDINAMLAEAKSVASSNNVEEARRFFKKWVPDYQPPA